MVTDGCVISNGAVLESSVLSPGVVVESSAVIRNSVILTDAVIRSGAVVDCAIIDKKVEIGENAHVGEQIDGKDEPTSMAITMVGKNSQITPGITVEAGAVIATDVIPSDYPMDVVRRGDYIQTKRLAYEV
ncbi:MAG: glucose-1-phosphate adenylyltransferase, partial [Anaerolineales bacterium]